MLSPARRRFLIDRLAGVIISIGGLATIACILAIFFFLFREVTPLFTAPTAKSVIRLTLPAFLAVEGPAQLGIDDHRKVGYLLTAGGPYFVDVLTGRPIPVEMPASLKGKRLTALAHGGGKSIRYVGGTAEGDVLFLKLGVRNSFDESGQRVTSPVITAGAPIHITDEPVSTLTYRAQDGGSSLIVLTNSGNLLVGRNLDDSRPLDPSSLKVLLEPGRLITTVALDATSENLYMGTSDGRIVHVVLTDGQTPVTKGYYQVGAPAQAVTKLDFLNGGRSVVVMTAAGAVSTWSPVRQIDDPSRWVLQRTHEFRPHQAPVTAFAPFLQVKGFATADAMGQIQVHHATSEQTWIRLSNGNSAVKALALAPKGDGLLAYDALGRLTIYDVHNTYPEVTWQTLFGKVWYEGYDRPQHVWQSSSGSDEFEPKLGLIPLAFGTLKGTIYALFLAIPVAILAAIYTSQFMHPTYRAKIKPTIEVMAALPTVVLGFLAGLWLAPLLERLFPALIGMALALPCVVILCSLLWHLVPQRIRGRLTHGTEALLLVPVIALTLGACLWSNQVLDHFLFAGNYKAWLLDRFGIQYDQRNALVVGIVMGFAIVPVIYSIAEEALSNVPKTQIAGSLALGATRWQTVVRLVLLSASPGIFSGIMIGFGRAIGETMIVLMATGNTPLMDWNWANGFRTLSANIAVEIPEAPQGGSLYRVLFLAALLLFIVTFIINSIAEIVRQRLRSRYSHG